MQPPDSADELLERPAPPMSAPHGGPGSEFPDDVALNESDGVSTAFEPDTGRRLKKAILVAGCVLLVAFIVVRTVRFVHDRAVAREGERAYSQAPPVDVVIARAPTGGQALVLPGQTAAWYESTIYARVNGYVANWLVDIGDHVKKGQLLATIETPELDAELNAAQAGLKAAEAQLVARQAETEFSRTTNERWRDAPKGVVSEQERDSKKADYDTAKARLYAANAEIALDRSRVEQYRALAEFKRVTAPFDGTITERKIDIGNLVTAGSSSTTTPLYRIAQSDPLRVFVDVPQSVAEELMREGVPAAIEARDVAGGPFVGKITRTAEAMNAEARTMRVEVDLPNKEHTLVPGMYVSVSFALEPKGSVEIPAAALAFTATGPQVARVGADHKVSFQKVAIVRDDGSTVELASGVQPGDALVLNISSQIAPGEVVAVRAGEAPDDAVVKR